MDDLKLYSKSERVPDSLIQTVGVFNEDIGMQFGIDKCATLVMKKGEIVKSDTELPNEKVISSNWHLLPLKLENFMKIC